MNLKEIKDIIKLMNENGLSEIEVEREGMKIKIRKGPDGVIDSVVRQPASIKHDLPAPASLPEAPQKPQASSGSSKEIVSPMVGTFYRAPSPESPPFAELGQIVEIGQVVCIVEAMKLMNEIKSEVRGKLVEIAVENAEPVEFGQILFVVEPV